MKWLNLTFFCLSVAALSYAQWRYESTPVAYVHLTEPVEFCPQLKGDGL